jgi:hypothetical protein
MRGTKRVDGVVVGRLHARKPYVMNVFKILFLDFATGIDIIQICINHKLQHHPGRVGAGSSPFVCLDDITDVKRINYRIDKPNRGIQGYLVF